MYFFSLSTPSIECYQILQGGCIFKCSMKKVGALYFTPPPPQKSNGLLLSRKLAPPDDRSGNEGAGGQRKTKENRFLNDKF